MTDGAANGITERIIANSDGLTGEPLSETAIDWTETASSEEVVFRFDGRTDTLVSWVYLDNGNMSVASASPTRGGDHVLVGECHPSTRVAAAGDATTDTSTVVLGGVSGYVVFEENSPKEVCPYKSDSTVTEVESRTEERPNQFAPISGAVSGDTEVRGYRVPSDGVNRGRQGSPQIDRPRRDQPDPDRSHGADRTHHRWLHTDQRDDPS